MEIEAREHPMVQAALARLATTGGWRRIVDGEQLDDRVDQIDADLLVAAGVLGRVDGGGLEVRDGELSMVAGNAAAIGQNTLAHLRRALRHAEGGAMGWSDDPEVMRAQGRGSAAVADLMRDHLLPLMPSSLAALETGEGRFLDVGTGVGAISARLCLLYPGTRATGIDVSELVLGLAREELVAEGADEQVEVRLQSVADLDDHEAYDLAWLPQPFIPPDAFTEGVRRVHEALRHDRWVLVPLVGSSEDADPFEKALFVHTAHLLGGGPTTVADAVTLLSSVGFTDVEPWFFGGQAIIRARRP